MRRTRFELLSLTSFVLLGLPDGMIGVAWPAMRASFREPLGDLGLVLIVTTAGTALISLVGGRLLRRFGVTAMLTTAACSSAIGACGVAAAPGLGVVLALVGLVGVGAGLVDGSLNTLFSLEGRQRLLNLLHGAYGVGAAIGPLLVTAAILIGPWRLAYGTLTLLELALAVAWVVQARTAPAEGRLAPARPPVGASVSPRPSRSIAVVALGMLVFFLYTGLEVAAGQWESSYGRGHLHFSATTAGLATFSYWVALTAARFALALPRRPVPAGLVVRLGCAGALLATLLVWLDLAPALSVVGFALLGLALGGIFPALVTLTPGRVGSSDAHDVIAWQIGAAVVGGSGLSALAGLLIDLGGLSILGPFLVATAVLLCASDVVLGRAARRIEPPPPRPDAVAASEL